MATSSQPAAGIRQRLLIGALELTTDTVKAALMQQGFTFQANTHETFSQVSANELDATGGYVAGGQVLTNGSITVNPLTRVATLSYDPASWEASGGDIGPTVGAVIYDDSTSDKAIIGYLDFGQTYTQAAGGSLIISGISVILR